jgi:dolichol-phosphate mannosyltransferase
MKTKPTLTVVMPALNEEANLAAAVRTALTAVGDRASDYEIFVVDDGSTDRTGAIADEIAASNPHVRVIHNARPRNLGGIYRQAIEAARFEYLVMVPGDNESSLASLVVPIEAIGLAEIIIPYVPKDRRARQRVILSRAYVWILNRLLGLGLRYYNGTVVHRVENLRQITIETDSFAYQSEALFKLIRAGRSYVEIPVDLDEPPEGSSTPRRSNALRVKNLLGVAKATARMAWGLRG